MWCSPQYLPKSTITLKSYFWPHSALTDGECLGKARKGDDAPPASIDSAKLGLPPSAGAALLQFASSALANPAAMPGLLEGPAG
jgi:hypothetical protein